MEQYHAIVAAGILEPDSQVELLEGVLVEKMSKNPKHSGSNTAARRAMEPMLAPGWHIRVQEPITLADSEPEPDIAVVQGAEDQYWRCHPVPSQVALVVEVADSSILRDRVAKARVYARAGIAVYWLIDLNTNTIEVRMEPEGDAYRVVTVYRAGDLVPVVVAGDTLGTIEAARLLPA